MSTVLTREMVDAIAPEHGRTSCNDQTLGNEYGGWTGKFDRDTGRKEVIHPRCNRCYLLAHIGENLEDLEFRVSVCLEWVDREKGKGKT